MPKKKTRKKTARRTCIIRGEESWWNFYTEGVSSSLLSLWLTCREQFRWNVIKGYRSRGEPESLVFGTMIHAMLQKMYRGKGIWTKAVCRRRLKAYAVEWRKTVGNPSQKQSEIFATCLTKAHALLPLYCERWGGDLGKRYSIPNRTAKPKKWLSTEMKECVEFEYEDGLVVPIFGTTDGLFADGRAREWILDTKCLSMINEGDIYETLEFNLQFMLYLWMYWKKHKKMPAGLIMNIMRRPKIVIPQDGDYTQKVRDHLVKHGWDYYFLRFELRVTKTEIQEFEDKFLRPVMTDLRMWVEEETPHYMNPLQLVTKYGRCEMFAPITRGDTSDLFQRQPGEVVNY